MNWCLFYQAEWNFPKIIESIIGITLWIEIQPKIIFFLPPSFQGEMPSKCWKWNSYWSHRLSDLLHPTIGQNFCPIQTDTSLKKKKKVQVPFWSNFKKHCQCQEHGDCRLWVVYYARRSLLGRIVCMLWSNIVCLRSLWDPHEKEVFYLPAYARKWILQNKYNI